MALTDELQRRLRETGRLEWAVEECRRLEAANDERDPETVWERLPRVGQLEPQARAVARQLAAWRERTAAAEDRPVGQVIQDPPLLELAKRHPRDLAALGQIRGLHPSLIKRRGQALLDAIRAGLADPPIPREARRGQSDASDSPMVSLAEALLRARAMESGLAYELIASRSDLEQIIAAARQSEPEPEVRTLSGWRRELVGADLESLLTGRKALAVGPTRRLELHELG
jgi:ribonuclease D